MLTGHADLGCKSRGVDRALSRKVGGTMRNLPVPDPGTPDHRSATRYLWWIVRLQWGTGTLVVSFGVVWMLSQALMPATIGAAIQQGVTQRDTTALAPWAGALFGL